MAAGGRPRLGCGARDRDAAHQGTEQVRLMTGRPAPVEAMRSALVAELAARSSHPWPGETAERACGQRPLTPPKSLAC